jgi:AraC-like DNA-binding protein
MVCERCIAVIKEGIANLGLEFTRISLGKLALSAGLGNEDLAKVKTLLVKNGFELISSRQISLVNRTKELIDDVFRENIKYDARPRFATLLSEQLNLNYDSISQVFTEVEGITLEKYIIARRLEKVKELLVYTDLRLTEIAYMTGFSSINHLSSQFKELTGFSPSHFKTVKANKQVLSGARPDNGHRSCK